MARHRHIITRTIWPATKALVVAITLTSPRAAWPATGLKWEQRDGYRVAAVEIPTTGRTGFTLQTPQQTGIHFTNQLSYERSEANHNVLDGAGVAAGDFDGDGWCDLYFCNLEGRNALYRNLGNWRFEDVTDAAGVACTNQVSRGATFADLNGDGHLDLFVTSMSGPNACLLNDGHGHFTDVTATAGLVLNKAGSHSAALADVDGDGDLDLYIANYGEYSILRGGGTFSVRYVNGKPEVTGRHAARLKIIKGQLVEWGEADVLYLNDGKGRFTPVSWTSGAFLTEEGLALKSAPLDMGLSVMFRDINGDGAPDLYVCNDFQTPDRIWINDGRGRFRALPDLAIRSTCEFSMGVDFADIDRDGRDDLFVTDMLSRHHKLKMTQLADTNPPTAYLGEKTDRHQFRHNALLLNRGDQTWTEIANFAGVDASDWSWSAVFLDVDLDGFEDLLIATGHAYDTLDLDAYETAPTRQGFKVSPMQASKKLKDYPPLRVPNVAFRNRGNRTFEEVGHDWGFDSTQISHGIALADLDNDGDLDVVVSCLWAPPLLYRNDSPAPRVAVRLRGQPPNTQGIGAKIKALGGAVPMQTQEIICGGRYLSGDDPIRAFAAGSLTSVMTIEITWRGGKHSVVKGATPNHVYEIDETRAQAAPSVESRVTSFEITPLFKDVSDLIAHVHEEAPFNDLERQPLLHRMLSALGPGVAWYDLDGDGHDELIIGGGRGGRLAVFRGDGKGGLKPWLGDAWKQPAEDDLTGIVGWTPAATQRSVLVGLSKYESSGSAAPTVLRFDPASSNPQPAIRNPQSPGPLAVADLDGDGDLDVFVGGRVVPGNYPEAASSSIYRNDRGSLRLDDVNNTVLKKAGLVSGAVFSDLDGDGFPELILGCEWGPVRVFQNRAGALREVTAALGLDRFVGWWNGVTTGDLDGDGRLDIIASNWGLNSSYHQPTPQHPQRLYFGDFDGNGVVDLIEAHSDFAMGKIVPCRGLSVLQVGLPAIRTRFPTHASCSLAEASAVIGEAFPKAQQLQANTLASMVFLNRGDRFEAVPLPAEAQFAPGFGVNVADFDGDGHEDIFLSQNFFAMRLEEPRLDAGRGLLLRGDGHGKLTPVPGQESGVKVYGEQRGSAVGDLDEDGRVDLVVAQNGAATKLYRNEGARPGLRVRLQGPPGDPLGIGATLRLVFGQTPGPAREVHGGSGYWSQDSTVQVLATPQPPTALWVRWPGGRTVTYEIPAGAHEVVPDVLGSLRVIR